MEPKDLHSHGFNNLPNFFDQLTIHLKFLQCCDKMVKNDVVLFLGRKWMKSIVYYSMSVCQRFSCQPLNLLWNLAWSFEMIAIFVPIGCIIFELSRVFVRFSGFPVFTLIWVRFCGFHDPSLDPLKQKHPPGLEIHHCWHSCELRTLIMKKIFKIFEVL